MKIRHWTIREEKHLRNSVGILTAKQIAYELGRTVNSVNNRARKLGLDVVVPKMEPLKAAGLTRNGKIRGTRKPPVDHLDDAMLEFLRRNGRL